MTLYLAAPTAEQITIRLEDKGKIVDQLELSVKQRQAEVFLSAIDKTLKKNRLSLDDITAIRVNNTGRSFSALRLAVSLANALAYAGNIPLSAEQGGNLKFLKNELARPRYDREPSISRPKKTDRGC